METQNKLVLEHLKKYGTITSLEAIDNYGITRLSARIYELRDAGEKIITRTKEVTNRFNRKVYVAEYSLVR